MVGKLVEIDGCWFVRFEEIKFSGGKKGVMGGYHKERVKVDLPLHPRQVLSILKYSENPISKNRVTFERVLVNPLGREVEPLDLTQNHSGCTWCAKISNIVPIKKEKSTLKFEEIFNNHKKPQIKEPNNYPKKLTIDELIDSYIDETGYGMDMWSKEESNTFTTIKKILYEHKTNY